MTERKPGQYVFIATGIEEVDSFARNHGFHVIPELPPKFDLPERVNVTIKAAPAPRLGNARPYLKKKKGRS